MSNHLLIENIYWFLAYGVIWEPQEFLDVKLITDSPQTRLSEREKQMLAQLTEKLSKDELRMLKDGVQFKHKAERAFDMEYDWLRKEIGIFFKYNQNLKNDKF